jgi:hypothetical protein
MLAHFKYIVDDIVAEFRDLDEEDATQEAYLAVLEALKSGRSVERQIREQLERLREQA